MSNAMLFADFYDSDPRDYAMFLLEEGTADSKSLLLSCLKFMSKQDIKDMLDDNELSPRFFESDEGESEDDDGCCIEEISSEERNACDHYNERFSFSYAD
jgi:hypothetical protein